MWLGYKGVIKQGRQFTKEVVLTNSLALDHRVLETNGKQKTYPGTQER